MLPSCKFTLTTINALWLRNVFDNYNYSKQTLVASAIRYGRTH